MIRKEIGSPGNRQEPTQRDVEELRLGRLPFRSDWRLALRAVEVKTNDSFEIRDGIAVITIASAQSFEAARAWVESAIVRAIAEGHKDLLVDGRDVQFSPPGIPARHEMVRKWGNAAQSRVRVAMVVRPEFVDSEKFAVVAAANFGLIANAFDNEAEAREWIRGFSASQPDPPSSTDAAR